MLGAQLRHIDYLDEEIGRLDEEITKRMLPFEEDLELLDNNPRSGTKNSRDHPSRNYLQYGSVSFRRSFMFLGRAVSRSERKRRKTIVRQDAKRKQEAPKYAFRGREGRG
jgi:hypothetical protein